jgi:enediyne biosynthesis protein E4
MVKEKNTNRRVSHQLILVMLMVTLGLSTCTHPTPLFESLSPGTTGVKFVNQVTENERYNVLEYMNIYTGAGVAAGDINNDGLVDLFFSGNQNGGRLYLNRGNLKFEDITQKAGVNSNHWQTGVTMVDVNQDGWLDIYVNVAGSPTFGSTANLLYINQGNGTFKEEAQKYGLAEKRLTMNASFFDYDQDGDLDVFMITNPADEMISGVNLIQERKVDGSSRGTDILYRNNGNGTFSDVSKAAGILADGYSLGCTVSDLNQDGYPDIYVSNDFLSNDILYINNGNGTFSDQIRQRLKHTSFASMGNDIADFNNDGWSDIFVLDMLPEDNFRRKMIIPAPSYDKLLLSLEKGYSAQYTRNTLQLNNADGTFSDVAFLAGVSATDWSWAALFGDYDLDGDKDLMATNGFYRDLGNLDYINYQARLHNPMGSQNAKRTEKLKAIHQLANIPLQSYLFENVGNLRFAKRSDEWGFTQKGFANGACYADLDNDGDQELIQNQFNQVARIYKNQARESRGNHFIKIKLKGQAPNLDGIGAKIWLWCAGQLQYQEMQPSRGYESSMESTLCFGLGKHLKIDSIKIVWPKGEIQKAKAVSIDQQLVFVQGDARAPLLKANPLEESGPHFFENISGKNGLAFQHQEQVYNDFKVQPLVPHLHSQTGPCISVGDWNGDRLEDVFIGGDAISHSGLFFQTANSQFISKTIPKKTPAEDAGSVSFDADNDGDLDLYVVSGSSEFSDGAEEQQDRLYRNDGKGNFTLDEKALPDTRAAGSCVVAEDYDQDGDQDLFVGGRVSPGSYPLAPRSYLLRNNGQGVFADATPVFIQHIGMVCAAIWSDCDQDHWTDLILVGEFMPITLIKNVKGKLQAPQTIAHTAGWWNSIAGADFDRDGDTDYIVGNLGLNARQHASSAEPLCVYAKDFDKNGRLDPVMCYFVQQKNYIYHSRDEMIKQINAMRGRFQTYEDFAKTSFEKSFTKAELADANVLRSECFESSYLENQGQGKFVRKALPIETQLAPLHGILLGDFNQDGFQDALLAGNDYATEASTGWYDAMKGVLLLGNGRGQFKTIRSSKSGFSADGNVKALASVKVANANWILVGNNSGALEIYRVKPVSKLKPISQ